MNKIATIRSLIDLLGLDGARTYHRCNRQCRPDAHLIDGVSVPTLRARGGRTIDADGISIGVNGRQQLLTGFSDANGNAAS